MYNQKFNFDDVFSLMQKSFPKNEYRTYENQKKLLTNKYYKIIPYFGNENEFLAFAAVWEFESFKFVEHIAVSEKCRGMGIGSKIMRDIIEKSDTDIILEIEPPNDETSIRRLRFYEKLGFKCNEYQYFQLPLNNSDMPTPLKILSYPKTINEEQFKKIKETIYANVYGKSEF
ncbi:MAG: GNAT family N-acetyltransferase [Clostridia bacterium]|nr:GNAT family N-acetyltransferase [Clostridia bacterium]